MIIPNPLSFWLIRVEIVEAKNQRIERGRENTENISYTPYWDTQKTNQYTNNSKTELGLNISSTMSDSYIYVYEKLNYG